MLMFGNSRTNVVLKYYLYKAIGSPGFYMPIYILYLLSNDVTYTQIGLIGTIQSVVTLGGEIPTGYVGDRIGRRNSLLVAQVTYVVAVVGFVVSTDFVGFAASFGLFSFATTFVSGSDQAWLYDTLRERLDEDTFTRVQGRGAAIRQWVMAVTMILGGLFYALDHVYPFLAGLVMRAATFAVILRMPQNAQYADDEERADEGREDDRLTILDALPIVREKLTGPSLRWFVAFVALFYGVRLTAASYIQPIAVETMETTLGPALSSVGVPEVAALGLLYASFTAVSAFASDYASNLEAALGVRKSLFVVPVVTCALFVVPAFVPAVAFVMFFVMRSSRSVMGPIVGQYLNDRIDSVGRATVLSTVSMVYAVVRMPFMVGSGAVADAFSPTVAVAALGGFFLVAGVGLFVVRDPIRSGVESATPEGAPEGTTME